jgi:hypothetical protein
LSGIQKVKIESILLSLKNKMAKLAIIKARMGVKIGLYFHSWLFLEIIFNIFFGCIWW